MCVLHGDVGSHLTLHLPLFTLRLAGEVRWTGSAIAQVDQGLVRFSNPPLSNDQNMPMQTYTYMWLKFIASLS